MYIICKFCNKKYASYSSRSNHIKKFHNQESTIGNSKVIHKFTSGHPDVIQQSSNKHICKNCTKEFKYKQGKWKHEQKCNNKKLVENQELEALHLWTFKTPVFITI